MTRVPFAVFVVALTALAALIAAVAAPARPGVVAGVAAGTGTAGAFAAVAVSVFRRIRAGAEGIQATTSMARAFAGLMMVRMLAYLALVMAAVALKFADPAGVGAGLVAGTLVFQTMEIIYLRKMT